MAADGPVDSARGVRRGERRLRRAERREQILGAASRAFVHAGFAATSLDDVAREAGVSKVILYRHFESKTDLYRAVLDAVCSRLVDTVGVEGYTRSAVHVLLRAAAADPDGFRLLFRHAAREPEFRDQMERFRGDITDVAGSELAGRTLDPSWAAWAAGVVPAFALEAVMTWLDAGKPDPDGAAGRILDAIDGIIQAAAPR